MSEEKQEKEFFENIVIIPTCGLPHIESTMMKIFEQSQPDDVYILSINPIDIDQAEATMEGVEAAKEYIERKTYKKINMDVLWHDKPLGFGVACNKGYEYAVEKYQTPHGIVFLNDDVKVTQAWLRKMNSTLYTSYYQSHTQALKSAEEQMSLLNPIEESGFKVGIVGPMSNEVAGEQGLSSKSFATLSLREIKNSIERRAMIPTFNEDGTASSTINFVRINTTFISGFCMMCHPEFLSEQYSEHGFVFDPIYNVGGFEDNDICMRAHLSGWGCLIDCSTYIHHDSSSTLSAHFEDQSKGMANWDIYARKWADYTQRDQKLIGAYRVAFPTVNALAQMGSSLRRNAEHLDGMSILLTAHPKISLKAYDRKLFDRLWPNDQDFLADSAKTEDPEEIKELFEKWLSNYLPEDFDVVVECWDFEKPMNERDERNRAYEMATDMGADWILSIDSDECIEDRLKKEDFVKLMQHPDPLTSSYTVGWINHYETMNAFRCDPPFTHGYLSGMNGVRMWRVFNGKHLPLRAGNNVGFHCGNAPEYGAYGCYGTSIRFRHLSMVREVDRTAKVSYYNAVDQDKDSAQIGGENYFHIGRSENVKLTLYNPKNGIGGFLLSYEGEKDVLVAEKILNATGCDEFAVVWTGEWDDSDKGWMETPVKDFPLKSEWREKYPTGPSHSLAVIGTLAKVVWLSRGIEHGLAECRNCAVEYFEPIERIGWCFYLDPDEFPENGMHRTDVVSSLRRMAESTDSWAFRFSFINPCRLKTGKTHSSISDAVRLFKSSQILKFRFAGKVHETLEDRFSELKASGHVPIVNIAPIKFLNSGLMMPPENVASKMRKYQQGLVETLQKDPYRSQSWCSLGLTYEQDGDEVNAEICYERACLVAGEAFLPFKLLATFYARRAAGLFHRAAQYSKNVESKSQSLYEIFDYLHNKMGEFPALDTGDSIVSQEFALPDFPYDKISYDANMNQVVIGDDCGDSENTNAGV